MTRKQAAETIRALDPSRGTEPERAEQAVLAIIGEHGGIDSPRFRNAAAQLVNSQAIRAAGPGGDRRHLVLVGLLLARAVGIQPGHVLERLAENEHIAL